MSRVNTTRVILAGLAAGVVINVVDFVVNVPILGAQWAAAAKAIGIDAESVSGTAPVGWITSDFLSGLFTAWLYAAIRPRYGPGARTALCAGLAAWFIVDVARASLVFQATFPLHLYVVSAAGALVAMLAGGWVAGRLYQEAA